MIARLYRPLLMGLLPIALIACMNPGPTIAEEDATVPLGIDLGGSGPVIAAAAPEGHAVSSQHRSDMQMAHAGHDDANGTAPSIPSIPRNTRSISVTTRSPKLAGRR